MYSGELTRTPPQKKQPRHLGLIVGVNHYQDSTFRPLQFAENDARALAQWLVNNKGGKWSPPDVQLVQGQHATRELVESLLTQICIQNAEEGDAILLYFAGHAFVDERSGEGYFALTNSRYQDPASCLSLLSFAQQILARSRATQILCIFDCFQTGPVWSMRRISPYDSKPLLGTSVLNILQSQPNRLFMCSCRGHEKAPESGGNGIGQLTHAMILGLSGPAVEAGSVTLAKLHAYLFSTLSEQQRPQLFGQQQLPYLLVGDLPEQAEPMLTSPHSTGTLMPVNMTGGTQTSGGLLKRNAPFTATATPPPAQSTTTGHSLSSALDQHRQQQSQHMMEQAQQAFQAQNHAEAFNLIEQVLQIAPNDVPALVLKGQLLGTASRYAEAQTIIEHILQLDPNNAMGWSMRSVVLSNQGQHQLALEAVERSLELDDQNPETHAIKNNIMGNLAVAQTQTKDQPKSKLNVAVEQPTNVKRAFLAGVALSILGILLLAAGTALTAFVAGIPAVGLLVASIGLGILCVNAARGAFLSGITLVLETTLFSLILVAILGAIYKVGLPSLYHQIDLHPNLFQPLLLAVVWLAAGAALPFLLALGGFVSGFPVRMRRKKSR